MEKNRYSIYFPRTMTALSHIFYMIILILFTHLILVHTSDSQPTQEVEDVVEDNLNLVDDELVWWCEFDSQCVAKSVQLQRDRTNCCDNKCKHDECTSLLVIVSSLVSTF